jgi:Xaa-Pro dipeptidase
MHDRLKQVQAWLRQQNCAAAFVTPGTNFFYLTGWHNIHSHERLTGLLLPADGEPALLAPALDREAAARNWTGEIRTWRDGEDPYALLAEMAGARGLAGGRWAMEKHVITLYQFEQAAAAAGVTGAEDLGSLLGGLRLRKTEEEVALLQQAADFLIPALHAARRSIRPGVTERQILRVLNESLLEAGSAGFSFEGIVLSGPNSALPHGRSGERQVERGDLVLIDFGGLAGGYCSDITRTFTCGEWRPEQREIYDAVRAAHDAGLAAVRPGAPCGEVDRAARSVIEQAGFGQYFIHRTGHGLGLDIHEPPWMTAGNAMLLEPGMVLTVEPGIYIPGRGGVRIEEMVVVTEAGHRVLTTYPNDAEAMLCD